jgi:hypothetical protein
MLEDARLGLEVGMWILHVVSPNGGHRFVLSLLLTSDNEHIRQGSFCFKELHSIQVMVSGKAKNI